MELNAIEPGASSSGHLEPDRQEQARRYARLNRDLMLADLGLGAAYLIFALLSGFSVWLGTGRRNWRRHPQGRWPFTRWPSSRSTPC